MPRLHSNGYNSLTERLNRFPQGAPPSELLTKILALLFTEKEAELVGHLPMHPFSPAKAAQIWRMREVEAFRTLESLAKRALLLDAELEGEKLYVLPPPMSGFFDFAFMRARTDIDQEALSRLLHQYLNLEEEFIKELFLGGETRVGRILVDEEQIPQASITRVLNYERASEVIKGASRIGVGTCYCRHKMQHLGHACSAAMETCLVFGDVAESLIRHGHAREIDSKQGLDLLQQSREQNLVQFCDNVQEDVSSICNCCSCCCDALIAARKFSSLRPVNTTNFIVALKQETCSGCGRCVDACPAEALKLVSANAPQHPWMRKCEQDAQRCLGCGVCVRNCRSKALTLAARGERVVTPVDTAQKTVLMAIERGKLQHLIWDNRAMFSHRAMAAIVGAILRLPPVKQTLARSQLGSHYLQGVIERHADRSCRTSYRY